MATTITHQLLAASLKGSTVIPAGRHRVADLGNVYLQVTPKGAMSWTFLYTSPTTGKRREAGIGPVTGTFGLGIADAKRKALGLAKMIIDGVDPLADKEVRKVASKATFKALMDAHIAACIKGGCWKNPDAEKKHWEGMLTRNAASLMDKPVDTVETTDIVAVLEEKWPSRGAEVMATRIRAIFDTAKAKGHLKGRDNPAAKNLLIGHLKGKAKTESHAALPAKDVPAFIADLTRPDATVSELGLAFVALTTVRSTEAREALRSEIAGNRWTIPAARMKMGKDHVVPLSKEALAIIERLPVVEGNPYLFAGENGQPINKQAFDDVIAAKGLRGVTTVHGLRSTFRDHMGDLHNAKTGAAVYERQQLEFCLAHVAKGTEGAYRRNTSVEGRAIIMQVWADYCAGKTNVTPMLKVAA